MKTLFLDTNILVDFVLEREGADDAAQLLQLGEDGKVRIAVSFLTIANLAYIIRKGRSQEEIYAIITDFQEMFDVLSMDSQQLKKALHSPAADFEDMLQYQCARAHHCDLIITRNGKHFRFSEIRVATPKEYLASR